jgi:hypothetical protein
MGPNSRARPVDRPVHATSPPSAGSRCVRYCLVMFAHPVPQQSAPAPPPQARTRHHDDTRHTAARAPSRRAGAGLPRRLGSVGRHAPARQSRKPRNWLAVHSSLIAGPLAAGWLRPHLPTSWVRTFSAERRCGAPAKSPSGRQEAACPILAGSAHPPSSGT